MESGRFLLAIVLMIAVVIVTNIIFPPARPDPGTALPPDTSAAGDTGSALPVDPVPPAVTDSETIAASTAAAPAANGADTVIAASSLYRYGISTRGGALVSAQLLEYASFAPGRENEAVELVPPAVEGLLTMRLRVGDREVPLSRFVFLPDHEQLAIGEDGNGTLNLAYRDSASGFSIDVAYTFHPDTYRADFVMRVQGLGGVTPQLLIDMGPRLALNEAVRAEDERQLAYVVNSPETGISSVPLRNVDEQRIENGPLTWVALKSKYFLAAVMQAAETPRPFGGVIATPAGDPLSANLTATLLPNERGEFAYRLYLGPQEFDRLAALGNQMQDVSVFGWRFLQPVLRPLGHAITWALLQMHNVLGIAYGWVLILFGFLIRFALWPLNAKAMRSQLKNMEMQPRMKELQARYKSDPQRMQQELLKLYKEEGFNPMGGCLPMLLPLPVLITLFFVFQGFIEFRGVSFLWLPDLSLKDPLYILPVALGLSMFVQQWLNMRSTKDAPPQMKYMTYFMPIFLTFLFLNFASGLNLYYAAMNVASLPQQLQIMRERQRHMERRAAKQTS
jgi:YidC/Oxa1 family membrane protein insertase